MILSRYTVFLQLKAEFIQMPIIVITELATWTKIGRLDFSLREHEEEVKALMRYFQEVQSDMLPRKCIILRIIFFLHLSIKCIYAITINLKFMFCICAIVVLLTEQNRIEYVYLSIKDAHNVQYNYMKITIFTLIGMIRLIGFNIQDIQIHVNIQFCNQ